jgi:hypothetical protein
MFLLLLNDRCTQGGSSGDHAHGDGAAPAPKRARWYQRLARSLQQMAVYLGDAYLAAEGCRGDVLCAAPEYFEDAINAARQRR